MPGTVLGAGDISGNKMGKLSAHPVGLTLQTVNGVVEITLEFESDCLNVWILLQYFSVTLNKSSNISEPQFIHVQNENMKTHSSLLRIKYDNAYSSTDT